MECEELSQRIAERCQDQADFGIRDGFMVGDVGDEGETGRSVAGALASCTRDATTKVLRLCGSSGRPG